MEKVIEGLKKQLKGIEDLMNRKNIEVEELEANIAQLLSDIQANELRTLPLKRAIEVLENAE